MPGNFDITVLGSSGGPLECITSSYLLKPTCLSYSQIIREQLSHCVLAIDAGSGLGRLTELVKDSLQSNDDALTNSVLQFYNDSLSITSYISEGSSIQISHPLKFEGLNLAPIEVSYKLFDLIKNYLITHPHLDHISGLVINSAGCYPHSNTRVFGLYDTIEALQKFVFNGIIWPNLCSADNGLFLKLVELEAQKEQRITELYQVTPFKVSHGAGVNQAVRYQSTAYLIRNTNNNKYILIFGDVESDGNSHKISNLKIWNSIATLLVNKSLNTILIECSTYNVPRGQPLYGHLTPNTLFDELLVLNRIIYSQYPDSIRPLNGLNVLITHVKDTRMLSSDPKIQILQELQQLNKKYELGINFTIALTGQTYTVP